MSPQTQSQNLELQLHRTLEATPQRVFDAWTDPKQMQQWFRPSDQFRTLFIEVDLRVGGRYRIRMRNPDGESHTVGGIFKEITPPSKLIYTWTWEEPVKGYKGEMADTLVTVELKDLGGKTELTLTHQRFPTQQALDMHTEGWTGCLEMLAKYVSK